MVLIKNMGFDREYIKRFLNEGNPIGEKSPKIMMILSIICFVGAGCLFDNILCWIAIGGIVLAEGIVWVRFSRKNSKSQGENSLYLAIYMSATSLACVMVYYGNVRLYIGQENFLYLFAMICGVILLGVCQYYLTINRIRGNYYQHKILTRKIGFISLAAVAVSSRHLFDVVNEHLLMSIWGGIAASFAMANSVHFYIKSYYYNYLDKEIVVKKQQFN